MILTVNDPSEVNLSIGEDGLTLDAGDTVNIGTTDYEALLNKPSINEVELVGDKSSEDLGLADAEHTHVKADITDFAHSHTKSDITDFSHTHTKSDVTDFAHTHTKSEITDFPELADVATSGDYTDLSNTPQLATVATSGNYNDLSNKPNLATVATSGNYNDLSNKPNLATVATSGSYNDLTNKPTIPNQNLFIVRVGYDSDEDEYYLTDASYDDICDAYDEGMALILIYTDEDGYAQEYTLSDYAPDDGYISFAATFSPAVVEGFTINEYDVVEYSDVRARTNDFVNNSMFVRGNSAVWEGACSTAGGTSAKYVNCSGFMADDQDVGVIIFVTFSNTNSAAVSGLTLNVQNRGAKPIKRLVNGQVANLDSVGDLTGTMPFFYDGTNWVTWYDTNTDTKVYQQYQAESGYSYWRPLLIGKSSSGTEGFTPSTTTDQTYVFKTLEVQPSTGTIRMGCASMFKGSYTSKVSPTTLTANRTITLPDASGTMALTNDIPENTSDLNNDSGFITLADLPIYNGGVG